MLMPIHFLAVFSTAVISLIAILAEMLLKVRLIKDDSN